MAGLVDSPSIPMSPIPDAEKEVEENNDYESIDDDHMANNDYPYMSSVDMLQIEGDQTDDSEPRSQTWRSS